MTNNESGGSDGEWPKRTYTMDDLERDYEGFYVECPDCGSGIYLDGAGECPNCELGYEIEVRFDG